MVHAIPAASPGPNRATYIDGYELYRSLYPTLSETFHRISKSAAGATA